MLKRPDTGAFIGAIAVFLLFCLHGPKGELGGRLRRLEQLAQRTAAYDGIIAVPVALLMIGGEFDLSSGVMIGLGTASGS